MESQRRYEVLHELARGGMAVLYVVRMRGPGGFEKHAVLKRIAPRWTDDEEFVQMFLTEARLAATLEHPHAIAVYDLGEDEDGPYFVMEYVHGVDLHAVLSAAADKGVAIPIRHVLTLGIAVAGGLHHAHGKGIVHRDVSPRNILVSYDGGVKVVDFGIAKAISQRTQTRPSIRKGKVGYMSPEQCRGDALHAASDVYALGVVLHELLTGQRLFKGEDEFAIMNAIVNHDAPPPSVRRAEVPACVDAVIEHALRRRSQDRIPSARALAAGLEAAAAELGLATSAGGLGEFVTELCGARPRAWEADRAPPPATPAAPDSQDSLATRVGPAAPEAAPRRLPWLAIGATAVLGLGAAWMVAGSGDDAERPDPAPRPTPSAENEIAPEPDAVARPPELAPRRPEPATPDAEAPPSDVPPAGEAAAPLDAPPAPDETARDQTGTAQPARGRAKPRPKKAAPKRHQPKPRASDADGDAAFDPDGVGPLRTILD